MCERCHGQFMAAWREEDAASEAEEGALDGALAQLGAPQLEQDDAPAPAPATRRAA